MMGVISSLLKPLKEQFKYRIRWRYLWRDWFLGRHACLGYEVLKHYKNLPREVNFQKGRADLLIEYFEEKSHLPKSSFLFGLMARKDILPLIHQLEFFDCLPKRPPQFIFMDSFSELTDQLFVHRKDGWKFCCGYSDITHSDLVSAEFCCNGLLPLGSIKNSYLNLFALFECRWGSVPIYFLHFPIALEVRAIYRDRYDAIINSIDEIALTNKNIHSIRIDESIVEWPLDASDELKTFPYHYNIETYASFSKVLSCKGFQG